MDNLVGTTLGNYRLIERIGEGGMGEVYIGEHRRISRRAAVKVLLPELSAQSALVERFLSEARTASLIRHPGIVEIFDCDEDRGRAFIVMELLEGETLAARLRRDNPLSPDGRLAAALGGEIAQAVAAAHACGVVHRDLKPDNVFLLEGGGGGGSGGLKVVDFGIAKLARPDAVSQTQTGALMGTPIYMSPEQCRGAGRVDHRADIYSLGCMMFEMVSGQPPFVKEGAGDLMIAHMTEAPPRVGALNPALPAALQALIGDMLAKDPAARPPSMAAVVARLTAASAVPVGTRTAVLPAVAQEEPETGIAAPAPARRPSSHDRASAERGLRPARGRTPIEPQTRTTLGGSAREQTTTVRLSRGPAFFLGGGAALAAMVGAVVLAIVKLGGSSPQPTVAPASSAEPPAEKAAVPAVAVVPAAPEEITVGVTNLPAGATLLLDGQPSAAPVRLARRPGENHVIKASAPGYTAREVNFTADTDVTIAIGLQRLAPPPAATPRPTASKPRSKPRPHESEFRALPDEPSPPPRR